MYPKLSTLTSNKFVFSGRNRLTGNADLYTISVSASNTLNILSSTSSPTTNDEDITPLNSSNIVTAALESSTNLIRLRHFNIQSNGSFVQKGERVTEFGSQLSATTLLTTTTLSRIVTAFINSAGNLRLVSWDINLGAAKTDNTTGFEDEADGVNDVSVFPNPVSNNATFVFHLNEGSCASLKIYNSLGEMIKEFSADEFVQGDNELNWSVENIPSGIYYYSFKSADKQVLKKIIITH